MTSVKVAINGYGVIGKRVADVVDDYRIRTAALLGIPVFAATAQAADRMRAAGIALAGDLKAMLGQADVVVDCTPKKVAAGNKQMYDELRIKSIFQGG